MKKLFAIVLSLLILASLLGGCGSSSNYATEAATPQEAPAASAPAYDMASREEAGFAGEAAQGKSLNSSVAQGASLSQRKIIKNGSIELETLEFDKALDSIIELVEKLGGYIESSDVSGTSLRYRGDYSQRYASFSARIPADKLNEATYQLGQLFNVLNKSESSSDITDTYYDTEGRLKSLRIQEERLLALLAKAEKLEDLITLESALADVRYQIESLTSQLTRYDNLVSYSTLSIHLQEVVQTTAVKPQPRTLGEKVADAFAGSLEGIAEIAEFILLSVVSVGPVLLVYGGVLALLVLGLLRIRQFSRQRRNPPPPRPPMPPKDEA